LKDSEGATVELEAGDDVEIHIDADKAETPKKIRDTFEK